MGDGTRPRRHHRQPRRAGLDPRRAARPHPRRGRAGRLARQPVPHWGTPDDIADAVAYLVTDGAGFISGQRLVVNGGMHFS
ncbi:MAG: SDR family oxidoreductase [Trebonia sp.]